jgi:hypothetical protein
MHKLTLEGTRAAVKALFGEHGLPDQIPTDNGEPFCCALSLSGLTRLAVWFMELGRVPVYWDLGTLSRIPNTSGCTGT